MAKYDITGSIQPRILKNGKKKYDVHYRYWDVAEGKRKTAVKSGFDRKGEAQVFLDELKMKSKLTAGVVKTEKTVADVADEWFFTEVEGKLRKNTCNWYRVNKDNHIIPHLGAFKIQDVTVAVLQELYDLKQQEGLSEASVYYIHRTLKQIYKFALKKHNVIENLTSSPELRLKRPKKKKLPIISAEEIQKLVQNCGENEFDLKLAIALAGFMGLRHGEVLGLRWSAIDEKNKTLGVIEQKTKYDTANTTSELKTDSSHRILPIPDVIWELICQQKERLEQLAAFYSKEYDFANGFVCCMLSEQAFGNSFTPAYFSKKFSEIVKRQGIKAIRFHDLRHSYASWLIHRKVPVPTVSWLLGHASPDITLKIYAHVINTAYLQECEEINNYLNAISAQGGEKEIRDRKTSG